MMHGALSDITQAVGNTPIVQLHRVTGRESPPTSTVEPVTMKPGGADSRQRQARPEHASARAEEHGLKPVSGNHHRGDERQHGRRRSPSSRRSRIPLHLRHARQDEPGEDRAPPRVRRPRRRLPDRRRAGRPAELLQRREAARRGGRQTRSLREFRYHKPANPQRLTLPFDGARDLAADGRRVRRVRRGDGHWRHDQRCRQVLQRG